MDCTEKIKRGWDIRVTTASQMSIRKTGIVLWRGSGFLWRTLKKEHELFCPRLFFLEFLAYNEHD